MSAKELCAMLITRSLKDLNDDEEEIVVDYLESIGIEVGLEMKPKEMCLVLLEKTMQKELGRKVPISAYANSLIEKKSEETQKKKELYNKREIEDKRKQTERKLEKTQLPGCVPTNLPILSKGLYDLVIDPDLGIVQLNDGTSQYSAVVSLSENLYNSIFSQLSNPILELSTSKGYKSYARIGDIHNESANTIYISPLVAHILNVSGKDGAFLRLCTSLPEISKAKFTYYGSETELDKILRELIKKLPSVVNAFSYLSLGMILLTNINNKEVKIRVDGLIDSNERPIFAGLIPFAETDLPFEIDYDL